MVSLARARSSGASGIAFDAETAARLRQMANADATSIFMGSSFPLKCAATRQFPHLRKHCGDVLAPAGLTTNDDASAGASDGDANGASDANGDGASDGPSGPVRA